MIERKISKKFSPNTKRIITTTSPKDTKLVNILLRISGNLDAKRKKQLQALGCQLNTIAADIITAQIPQGDLSKLGELEFVRYIEISQPLYPEE